MEKILKLGASIILSMIVMPFLIWGGGTILELEKEIARIEIINQTTKEILLELKTDIKEIRNHLIEKR